MSEERATYRLREILEVARSPIDMKDEDNYMLASIRRRNGGMFDRETKRGKEILTKTLSRVIPGSFVISKMQVVHGACGMAPHDFGNRCISASYASLVPREPQKIDIRYLDAYATTKQSYDAFIKASHGVHIEKMTFNLEDWLNGEIELPPLPEQKKIAEILSGIDLLIKALNNLIAKQESLRKAMTWDLMSHGAGTKELKDSERGKIPFDWEVRPLGSVFTLTSGKSKPKSLLSSVATDGEKIPVYGGNGITGYTSDHLLDLPTIAIGRVGEYCGAVHLTPNMSWVTDNALYIKDRMLDFDLPFMYHFLAFCEISRMRKQGGQPLISQKPILDLMVALPPTEEQRRIALILDSISKNTSLLKIRRQRIRDLKDSVSQDLLSGRKRVSV